MAIFGGTGGGGAGVTDHGALTGLADDDHAQYLHLSGRTGGQRVGSLTHTGGATFDIAFEGRFLLTNGVTGVNYSTGRLFDFRTNCTNNTTLGNYQINFGTGLSGTATGTLTGLQILGSGTFGYTGGSFSFRALIFVNTGVLPANVTCAETIGGRFQSSMQETVSGTQGITNQVGLEGISLGPSIANTGHIATLVAGVKSRVNNRAKEVDAIYNYYADQFSGSVTNNVTDHIIFGNRSTYDSGTGVFTNFYGLLLDTVFAGSVTNIYGVWINANYHKSVIGHKTTIGAVVDPVHGLDSQASFGLKTIATQVANYNAGEETLIPCDATAGAFAVNLPSATGIDGRIYIIKQLDASGNNVTITPNGAETIDGAGTLVLNAQWAVARIQAFNNNWLVI